MYYSAATGTITPSENCSDHLTILPIVVASTKYLYIQDYSKLPELSVLVEILHPIKVLSDLTCKLFQFASIDCKILLRFTVLDSYKILTED